MFLRTGQAAIVPPGCMVFLAGKGLLPEGFAPSDLDDATRSPGCQFLVPFSLLKEFEDSEPVLVALWGVILLTPSCL